MYITQKLFILCLVGFPLCATAQESDPIVRREMFDPLDRTRPIDPTRAATVAGNGNGGTKCGTGRGMDAAMLAEGTARVAANAAAFRAAGLRGYVQAATEQRGNDNGIEFQITFVNEGSEPIELGDMTNALRIVLFRNSTPGGPPGGHVLPSWSFERNGPPKYDTEFPDEAEVRAEAKAAKKESERNRPYRVEESSIRPKGVRTIRDFRDEATVSLRPGQSFQMTVRITEGLADPVGYWWNLAEKSKELGHRGSPTPDPSDIAPLSAGEYSLSFSTNLSISTGGDDETPPVRCHAYLSCGAILIQLGN